MRIVRISLGVLPLVVALAGCASQGPASERGFFGGIGAAVSGADERQASAMENEAAVREARLRDMAARASQAESDARSSSADVQAAEQRLAALRADIRRQRDRLSALRSAGKSASEADRIQAGLDQLDRDQRAAAAGGVSPAALRSLEDRTRSLNQALARLGAT